MTENHPERLHDIEQANYLFQQLLHAIVQEPVTKCYSLLAQVFQQILFHATASVDVQLVGDFAKVDYLLKLRAADIFLRHKVNTARIHIRHAGGPKPDLDNLALWRLADFEALVRFVALVYSVPIPDEAQALFPLHTPTEPRSQAVVEYLRIIVSHFDDQYIYGTLDSPDAQEATVAYTGGDLNAYHFDWACIRPLLAKGVQLNLVRPTLDGNIYRPELIIIHPDYLVDITTIASCFEDYAQSATLALIAKLKPSPSSSAILLGNLSGQMLDDELHHPDTPVSYSDSLRTFFRNSPLEILTTPIDSDFHQQAQQQRDNIHRAIAHDLPKDVATFDPRDVILEPSFFSEMLGLQGRMDFLQMDHEVLIEQKSGKCGWPQIDPSTPRHKLSHQVQTLLYMALLRYNYSDQYLSNVRRGHGLQAFLMYSRYPRSLTSITAAPDLLFQAINIRNQIASNEFQYSDGGFSILDTLSPDDILPSVYHASRLWTAFVRPQLEELLAPIHKATPLERAYHQRLLTFVAREHLLAKIGNRRRACSGFASVWNNSLGEKLQSGNIFAHLQLVEPEPEHQGAVSQLHFSYADDSANDMANFRIGDIVIAYPYPEDCAPDARRTFVFRGSIHSLTPTAIVIRLRAPQGDARPILRHAGQPWAIEHDFLESSFSGLYRGVHAFLSAPQERRDLILLQRPPKVDASLSLCGSYGPFDDLALRVRQAQELFLIIGPPGTGKTSYGLINTLLEQLLQPDTSVLLMAYTNRAVDEICDRLIQHHIDFLRLGSETNCSEPIQPYLLSSRIKDLPNIDAIRSLVDSTRVIVSTTTSLNSHINLLSIKQFSLAIIDEASQILEPQILGILSASNAGLPAIQKFVLIGDHKQLPAVVQQTLQESAVHDPLLLDIHLTNCRLSLFERLLMRYRNDPSVVYMLTHQGRMHESIAEFPSRAFYQGLLSVVPLPHQIEPPVEDLDRHPFQHRLAFFHVEPLPDPPSDKVNPAEADAIACLCLDIYRTNESHFNPDHTLGIIVPYRNQIAAIRHALAQHHLESLSAITIDTVERFQGSQRDYIIFGLTVQHRYQLDFLAESTFYEDEKPVDRKLNVALTRARSHQILVGNIHLLSRLPLYDQLIDYCRHHNILFCGYPLCPPGNK
ncbi:MAG: AAA family ATPase [Bacteroidales bacterium]|nr:AAA family ATPase [Bacteroidales bacterium]